MNPTEAIPSLERLLKLLCRSLPAYLANARPWAQTRHHEIQAALDRLVTDQQMYARRVAEAITQCGGRPDPGRFPASMAAKNDLGLEFLLQEVIDDQQRAAAAVERSPPNSRACRPCTPWPKRSSATSADTWTYSRK